MNITTEYQNRTNGKIARVVTDRTGTWCEGSEVLSREDAEMGRDGDRLSAEQTNKLFAYWHSAGHDVRRA